MSTCHIVQFLPKYLYCKHSHSGCIITFSSMNRLFVWCNRKTDQKLIFIRKRWNEGTISHFFPLTWNFDVRFFVFRCMNNKSQRKLMSLLGKHSRFFFQDYSQMSHLKCYALSISMTDMKCMLEKKNYFYFVKV